MLHFELEGVEVEIEGVSQDDLPESIDLRQLWNMMNEGKSATEMLNHVRGEQWVESGREQEFWDTWEH